MESSAILSDCRKYRFTLWRRWAKYKGDLKEPPFDNELKPPGHSDWGPAPYCMFIGLNPSTADETKDDPTIRKCIGFAKKWGYGALCMTNLFAWRETDPKKMMREALPVGENNLELHLASNAAKAGIVIAAWGKDGKHRGQDKKTWQWLQRIPVQLHCLRKNSDGSPGHPLYIPYTAEPTIWTP